MGSNTNGVVGDQSGTAMAETAGWRWTRASTSPTTSDLRLSLPPEGDALRSSSHGRLLQRRFQEQAPFHGKHRKFGINLVNFLEKAVLDVGAGSGILAIWSAQAGARKVYAVEATSMAEHARAVVKANNLQDVVEVIEGSMEDVVLPEKVDVIISEWMGYFLLRESMFDSVICARDRWLKPTGVMYPSHASMWVAPIRSGLGDQKSNDYESSMEDWYRFTDQTKNYYGVDMSVLTKPFSQEQKKYYLQTSMWNNLHPHQVIGTAATVKEIDCLTASNTRLCGFGGWFDVHFRGRKEDPAEKEIELTTAPSVNDGTHWGQQVFLLDPPIRVSEGDKLNASFSMNRSKENHRLMEVEFSCEIRQYSGELLPPFRNRYFIE
ncbi:protein arginine N-methyltransferase PRMT10 [Prunus yedoensis var. nudiflora]|uniref:Protein arginine N-methyltransferase PRMT10 n=1 Tax=Prunus yedoensis var. nudiflora TaxID=2094558 RepID=A0A314ZLQ0_PRUYE|nr:protein arginine N-methyltransferase PRMT10 [Prunus yedoensis var. nudiflora]